MQKIQLISLCLVFSACELQRIDKSDKKQNEITTKTTPQQSPNGVNDTYTIVDKTHVAAVGNKKSIRQKAAAKPSEKIIKNSEIVNDNSYVIPAFKHTPINEYDAMAMKMAGTYAPNTFVNNPVYINYVKFLNNEWDKLFNGSISLIDQWSADNIGEYVNDVDTIFYPFGGPDVTYPIKFFPNASTFVLVGLERIGNICEVEKKLSNINVIPYLKEAMISYLRKGYFITSEMQWQLSSNCILNGTLYAVLLQLSKLDFEINSIEELGIDQDGNETPKYDNRADCVKITCTQREKHDIKTVYYVRMDLRDGNPHLDRLMKFLDKYSFGTLIKSASYALHDRSLSKCKHFILDKTLFVLQDDTGMPFKDFNSKWDRYAFGMYTKPTLPVFKCYVQKSLASFFSSMNPKKIPFKIGYGYHQNRPNLLLAVLKTNNKKVNASQDYMENQMEEAKSIVYEMHNIRQNSEKPCASCGDGKNDNLTEYPL